MEESPVDDVLVARPFVFKDRWRAILVNSKRVDPATVPPASRVLGRQKSNAEERLHVAFDRALEVLLQSDGAADQFGCHAAIDAEQLEVARPDTPLVEGVTAEPGPYQPRSCHSGNDGRSAPIVEFLPWPG
jgi:hypothetical protein